MSPPLCLVPCFCHYHCHCHCQTPRLGLPVALPMDSDGNLLFVITTLLTFGFGIPPLSSVHSNFAKVMVMALLIQLNPVRAFVVWLTICTLSHMNKKIRPHELLLQLSISTCVMPLAVDWELPPYREKIEKIYWDLPQLRTVFLSQFLLSLSGLRVWKCRRCTHSAGISASLPKCFVSAMLGTML